MAGLFSDMRKTAIGAVALLVIAVLFAEPGGLGGHVVEHEEQPHVDQAAALQPPPAPARAPSRAWFSDGEPEPQITPAPVNNSPPPSAAGPAEPAPMPVGPDFPPGLAPPR
jgi:hypothetical protein